MPLGVPIVLFLLVANFVAIFAVRRWVAHRFGFPGVHFWPGADELIAPGGIRLSTRLGIFVASALAPVLVAMAFSTAGRKMDGEWIERPEIAVSEGSAAAKAGLEDGDVIVSIDGAPVNAFTDIRPILIGHTQPTLPVVFERGGTHHEVTVTPDPSERKIGVRTHGAPLRREVGLGSALVFGMKAPFQTLGALAKTAFQYASPSPSLGSTVSMVRQADAAGRTGPGETFLFIGAVTAYLMLLFVPLAWFISPHGARRRSLVPAETKRS